MAKFIVALLIIIAVVVGGYFAYGNGTTSESRTPRTQETSASQAPQGKLMSVEEYVRQNISSLSPIPESLGGTFYVTEIEVEPENRTGKVKYEDGHMAYEAEFTYTSSDRTGHTIISFVVNEQ